MMKDGVGMMGGSRLEIRDCNDYINGSIMWIVGVDPDYFLVGSIIMFNLEGE